MKRTPLKRGSKGLAKVSKNRLLKKEQERVDDNIMWYNLSMRYQHMPPGEKRCQSCGKELNAVPRTYYFDHLIEKSKRPDLASNWDNIFLCCLECHSLKTAGFPTEPHRLAIEKAKEKFGA